MPDWLVSLWSPIFWKSPWENVYAWFIAGRLTRKYFRRRIAVIFDVGELTTRSKKMREAVKARRTPQSMRNNIAMRVIYFFLERIWLVKVFWCRPPAIIDQFEFFLRFYPTHCTFRRYPGIYIYVYIKTPISVFLCATANFVFDQCATYSGPALHLHSRQIQFPRNKADVPKRAATVGRFSLWQERCR